MQLIENIDPSGNSVKAYLRIEPIRHLIGEYNFLSQYKKHEYLCANVANAYQVFYDYVCYQKKYKQRNYKGVGRSRAYERVEGNRITIMVDSQATRDKTKLTNLVKKFMSNVIGSENLVYCAWLCEFGYGSYLVILLLDREYGAYYPVYEQDIYRNRKGQLCKKDAEGAVLVCKKGERKTDSHGNHYPCESFNCIKSRLFKDEKIEVIRARLLTQFVDQVRLVCERVKKEFFIKREQIKQWYSQEYKRLARRRNQLKIYVENKINYLLSHHKKVADWHDIKDGAAPGEILKTRKGMQLENLFYKCKKRFEKGSFHDIDNVEKKILHDNVYVCYSNCDDFEKQFDLELSQLLVY